MVIPAREPTPRMESLGAAAPVMMEEVRSETTRATPEVLRQTQKP